MDVTGGTTAIGAVNYQYAYPTSGGTGCTVSGGSGATLLSGCAQTATGELVLLCAAGTNGTAPAVALLRIGGTVLSAATLADLQAAAAGGSMTWQGLGCDGAARTGEGFVLRPDGSADWTIGGSLRALSAGEVVQLFGNAGLTTTGTDQRTLRAYRQTVLGVHRYHLMGYGAPLAGVSGTVSPGVYPAP